MTPEKFCHELYGVVAIENIEIYRELFLSTSVEEASDPYWKDALNLFDDLSPQQRESFFSIIRQVSIDATSNVLGIIDGVNVFNGSEANFKLMCNESRLEGDLQSLFLTEAQAS
jgi:hypothetical protein